MSSWILASAAAESPVLGVDTAVLILLTAGVIYLAKTLFDTRRELASLRERLSQAPAAAPAGPSSGAPAAAAPAAVAAPAAAANPGEVPAEVRAAIAAAVAVLMSGRARVVSVAPAMLWSQEGRRQVFQSHRVR